MGEITTRREVAERFGGARFGGIQPSQRTPNVMIYTDPGAGAEHGYLFDAWDPDDPDVFYYSGEGQTGDQQLDRGNRAILKHRAEGRTLRVFEVASGDRPGGKLQRYVGAFEIDREKPYRQEWIRDAQGRRQIYVFKLRALTGDSRQVSTAPGSGPTGRSEIRSVEQPAHHAPQPQTSSQALVPPCASENMPAEVSKMSDSRLRQLLERHGFVALFDAGSTLPDVVAMKAGRRPIAIDEVPSLLEDSVAKLNRKVGALRQVTPQLQDAQVSRLVVDLSGSAIARFSGPSDEKFLDEWIRSVPEQDLDDEVVQAVVSALQPNWVLTLPSRESLADNHAAANAAHRVVLDEFQRAAAQHMSTGNTIISGPPGSGKTLVLVARARWLADTHPDWNIRLLCYNRVLVPYLRSLLADIPQVKVSTFGRFASELGVRISLDDETAAARHVANALHKVTPSADAVLIDEAQDFMPPWIEFIRATLRPERGGLVMAGDPHQALYRDSSWIADLESGAVQRLVLQKPYRSTRPILTVTQALDESLSISGLADAVDGEPADLVWANSTRGQVDAVVADVGLLVDAGVPLADIGILVTRRWRQSGVARALSAAGFATEIIYPRDAELADLSRPTIKVLTTHSAKGYEFGAVILVGLEDLPNPDGLPEHDRQMRTAYVGATRARDRLIITYTKVNDYLEKIRSVPDTILRRWTYPDDYGVG